IFADPPYQLEVIDKIPDLVLGSGILKSVGILVLEHSAHSNFENHPALIDHRNYGSVNFSFFRYPVDL
ncbi:MAG: RsmD family RNA methyltransferase, partial [Bacteroidales bacterium]|nr:RsmD family RNA methyltransferase [Bacteroidales bacterium]